MAVEAAKTAKIHGVSKMTLSMMRDGLEALEMSEEKWLLVLLVCQP